MNDLQDHPPGNLEKEPYSLSIVMPVFNEQDVIAEVVAEFATVLKRFQHPEFIMMNDCSTDRTQSILESLRSEYPFVRLESSTRNRGHGPTLAHAFRESTGEYIFHADSDRQFFAEDFWILWHKMQEEQMDLVIGCREDRKDPVARILLTKLVRLLLLILFRLKLPDSNSPFRLYRRKALDRILAFLPEEPMIPSILMVVAAYKLGMQVGWARVRHLARTTGKSFLRSWKVFRLCVPAAKEVFQFRARLP